MADEEAVENTSLLADESKETAVNPSGARKAYEGLDTDASKFYRVVAHSFQCINLHVHSPLLQKLS